MPAKDITDPAVRAVFEAGEASGRLKFLYATKPAAVKYYVFFSYDEDGNPSDHKLTATQIVGAYGSPPTAGS